MIKQVFIFFLLDVLTANDNILTTYNYHKLAYIALNDGNKIPVIGYGTWLGSYRKGESYQKITKVGPEVELGLERAIDAGYRLIETSPMYNSEEIVGRVLSKKIHEGVVRREDMFIVTKLDCQTLDRVNITRKFMHSLQNMGINYIDLYLIQFPESLNEDGTLNKTDLRQLWRRLIELRYLRYVRSIGVSNFDKEMLDDISSSGVVPAVLEIEMHLSNQHLDLVAYCKKFNITIIGNSPLGNIFSRIPGDKYDDEGNALSLSAIARDTFRTQAQISLRYLIQLGVVPIVRTVLRNELEEWAHVFDFELSDEEMHGLLNVSEQHDIFDLEKRVKSNES